MNCDEARHRLFCDYRAQMLWNSMPSRKGKYRKPRYVRLRALATANVCGEAVAPFVQSLNAVFGVKFRTECGNALENTVSSYMRVAPESFLQFVRRYDTAPTRNQQLKCCKFPWCKMNLGFTAKKCAIRLKAKACK